MPRSLSRLPPLAAKLLIVLLLVLSIVCLPCSVCAADPPSSTIVDAGALTDVFVSATYFDARGSDDRGCDPDGCIGSLTRVSFMSVCLVVAEFVFGVCNTRPMRAKSNCTTQSITVSCYLWGRLGSQCSSTQKHRPCNTNINVNLAAVCVVFACACR